MRKLQACLENGLEEFSDDGFHDDDDELYAPVLPESWAFNMGVVSVQATDDDDKSDVENYSKTLLAIQQSIEQLEAGRPFEQQCFMDVSQDTEDPKSANIRMKSMKSVFDKIGLTFEDGVYRSEKYNIAVTAPNNSEE